VVSGGWIIVGVAIILGAPKLAAKVGQRLTQAEGLSLKTTPEAPAGEVEPRPVATD